MGTIPDRGGKVWPHYRGRRFAAGLVVLVVVFAAGALVVLVVVFGAALGAVFLVAVVLVVFGVVALTAAGTRSNSDSSICFWPCLSVVALSLPSLM